MKKPNTGMVGSFLASSDCRPDTTRLVDVPMSVTVPPSTVAKDSGMSSFFTGTLQLGGWVGGGGWGWSGGGGGRKGRVGLVGGCG